METKPHKPALLRNNLVVLLRDFFSPLSKNQHKEKDPFESLIKYYKKLKVNNHYLIIHHYNAGHRFLKNQFRYPCPGGEKGNNNKKTAGMIHEREAVLDMLGMQGKCWTAASHSTKALKIPFVLQKGRKDSLPSSWAKTLRRAGNLVLDRGVY